MEITEWERKGRGEGKDGEEERERKGAGGETGGKRT